MNIVTPYACLMSVPDREAGIALLRKIEWIGRISHRSEEAQTEESWERFLRTIVLGHGDWSIVEHASVTVDALVDRGIQQEWTRHRLFAYTVESTRFVNYAKKRAPTFVVPCDIETAEQRAAWEDGIAYAEATYQQLLREGCAPQTARSVFPLGLASRMVISGNLRQFRHLFLMRTTKETHPQFRQISLPLLAEFQEKIPILFEDIAPNAKQSDNLKKAR